MDLPLTAWPTECFVRGPLTRAVATGCEGENTAFLLTLAGCAASATPAGYAVGVWRGAVKTYRAARGAAKIIAGQRVRTWKRIAMGAIGIAGGFCFEAYTRGIDLIACRRTESIEPGAAASGGGPAAQAQSYLDLLDEWSMELEMTEVVERLGFGPSSCPLSFSGVSQPWRHTCGMLLWTETTKKAPKMHRGTDLVPEGWIPELNGRLWCAARFRIESESDLPR